MGPQDGMDGLDRAALRRIQAGDGRAVSALYDRHAQTAFAIARRIVTSDAAAEDVVQEAFVGLWRRASHYRAERGSVRAWLLGIVRHRAIDALRRDAVRPPLLATDRIPEARAADGLEEVVERRIDAAAMRAAVAALPEAQARPIELAFYGGLTQREIAGRLSVPLGTVKSRIRLGLGHLAAGLTVEAVS